MAENGKGRRGARERETAGRSGTPLGPQVWGEGMRGFTHGTGGIWKSVPQERERGIEMKIAQVAQGPRGVGQAHAQVTGGAPPGPLPSWNT